MYKIEKVDTKTKRSHNYGGGYTAEDIKQITKGYKPNGLFYERKGSRYFYIVEQEH